MTEISAIIRPVAKNSLDILVKKRGLDPILVGNVHLATIGQEHFGKWVFKSIEGNIRGPFDNEQLAITALLKDVWGR